ncbi:flagellar hook-basal body complex protein [Butyrivibrio sp. AC2005]|uniref:flagellar hook-basal body complex protein n=1 Tax=Butyrivibrio sp. AC2005 TaxID=1280672 RepID=UPI0003FE1EFE|nr:flagellar hook-basal body complex protein [Butyrivibrio sp. AC2005]
MMRSLFSGVAGLKTHQVKMDVIGNNIANVNTTSFKSQSITFSDLMYQTSQRASRATETTGGTNARQVGLGAKSGAIATAITQQGATETTNNPFDMRITGDAFFVVNNGNQTMFTRDGSFYVDGAGNLAMQSTGYFVYGWTAAEDPETGAITVNTNGGIGKLQIMTPENMTYPPEGTTEAVVSGNIDAHDTNITSDNGKTVSLEFYDNLGYLYTAKFAVRDVDDTEHAYTMTLEDILDSKGNTIGADKLARVIFTDDPNYSEETYKVRDPWLKEITTVKYSAVVGAQYTTFKNAAGATAYSKVPTTGIVSSLTESFPSLLAEVYGEKAASPTDTDYYEIDSDGRITFYPVTNGNPESGTLAPYYVSGPTDTIITYNKPEGGNAIVVPKTGDWDSLDADKKDALARMFGFDQDDIQDMVDQNKEPSYTISNDGVSKITFTPYDVQTKYATDLDIVISPVGNSKAKITTADGETYTVTKKDALVSSLSAAEKRALGITTSNASATYTINTDAPTSVTVKVPISSEQQPYENENKYAVDAKSAAQGKISFINLKTNKATVMELSGTTNSLSASMKNILEEVYGFVPTSDDVTYTLADDGSTVTVGTRNTATFDGPFDIDTATREVDLDISYTLTETTATYTNNIDDSTIYENIPRNGYVSEIYDATLTKDFFSDVYNYNPDPGATNYENLTYHILEDGTLQVVNNSISMNYNEKTGAIENPTEKIPLRFVKESLIENGVDLMGGFTNVNMDLSTTTNYNTMATSTIGAVKGDKQSLKTGRAVGEMNGVTVSKDGTIYATYSNGQTKLLGQIATAEFANASGLEKNGDNLYTQTLNSGEATIQDVTTDGGYITTGVLEMSNVDLSSEFTSMITTQRGFQANSRIITVSDTLLEELTNLKR